MCRGCLGCVYLGMYVCVCVGERGCVCVFFLYMCGWMCRGVTRVCVFLYW